MERAATGFRNGVKITLGRGVGRWEWDIETQDGLELTFRTGPQYQGLYSWDDDGWHLVLGKGEYSLPEDREAALRELFEFFRCTHQPRRLGLYKFRTV